MIQNGCDTVRAACRQPPQCGPTDENRIRSERHRLQDIGATPYAAVNEDLNLRANGIDDFRQRSGRRDRGIQVATTMVRHDDRFGAGIDASRSIVASEDSFDDNIHSGPLNQPFEIGYRRWIVQNAGKRRVIVGLGGGLPGEIDVPYVTLLGDRVACCPRTVSGNGLIDG